MFLSRSLHKFLGFKTRKSLIIRLINNYPIFLLDTQKSLISLFNNYKLFYSVYQTVLGTQKVWFTYQTIFTILQRLLDAQKVLFAY